MSIKVIDEHKHQYGIDYREFRWSESVFLSHDEFRISLEAALGYLKHLNTSVESSLDYWMIWYRHKSSLGNIKIWILEWSLGDAWITYA